MTWANSNTSEDHNTHTCSAHLYHPAALKYMWSLHATSHKQLSKLIKDASRNVVLGTMVTSILFWISVKAKRATLAPWCEYIYTLKQFRRCEKHIFTAPMRISRLCRSWKLRALCSKCLALSALQRIYFHKHTSSFSVSQRCTYFCRWCQRQLR